MWLPPRPPGAARLTAVRALLGGGVSVAVLPWIVAARGGDGRDCLRLGALFAVATLASELPAALAGDRSGRARPWLACAGLVQALGLATIALGGSFAALAWGVVVVGVGAGLSTGAEGRAALSIGRDARGIASLEVSALLGKGGVACASAVLATLARAGASGLEVARTAIALSALGALLAALIATTLRSGDRVRGTSSGRRDPRRMREERIDRRRWGSFGVLALIVAVSALSVAARGTDTIDALGALQRGGGVLLCALVLAAKGVIARLLAPAIARRRVHGIAVAAAAATLPLALAPRLGSAWLLVDVAIACGLAGAAAAAARGVLLARVGPARAGVGVAIEASVRRLAMAAGALGLAALGAPSLHGGSPYLGASCAALLGGLAALAPRVRADLRRRLRVRGGVGDAATRASTTG